MIIVNPPRAAAQSYAVMSKGRPVAMTLETLNGLGQTDQTIIEKEVVDWKTIGIAAAITVLLVLVLTGGKKE